MFSLTMKTELLLSNLLMPSVISVQHGTSSLRFPVTSFSMTGILDLILFTPQFWLHMANPGEIIIERSMNTHNFFQLWTHTLIRN